MSIEQIIKLKASLQVRDLQIDELRAELRKVIEQRDMWRDRCEKVCSAIKISEYEKHGWP